ncbi:MAG TPA: bifunctional precorrin-2 dehydrogenase/sirohydrochlorin ferrochelatase [Bacillota bacterium]|nr:bifunctional precorrin-2 dehydrogenase/sirohydrochlorin ferrochelatase [Bacillota bacterium]
MPRRYFISLDLEGKHCLVVGGGRIAERKVMTLLECGALVRVVSPEITPVLRELAEERKISYRRGVYKTSDLEGVFLAIGSTNREDVNRQVADDCSARNIIVNIVDNPEKSNFYVPAVLKRGSLTIAVSTDGKSPMLARKIKEDLERIYGAQYGEFLDMLGDLRRKTAGMVPDSKNRRKLFEDVVNDTVLKYLKEGRMDLVKERMLDAYRSGRSESQDGSR